MQWLQKEVILRARDRGCHIVTDEVLTGIQELNQIKMGLCHVFIHHTSAALSVNENSDPSVRRDMEMAMNRIVSEGWPYEHNDEGIDDMPAHIKAALVGSSISLPVADGKIKFGTWQGIYLHEFRNHAGPRKITITLCGQPR